MTKTANDRNDSELRCDYNHYNYDKDWGRRVQEDNLTRGTAVVQLSIGSEPNDSTTTVTTTVDFHGSELQCEYNDEY